MEFNKMPIIQTYYNIFQCLECGNTIILKDVYKSEFFCFGFLAWFFIVVFELLCFPLVWFSSVFMIIKENMYITF